MQWIQDLGRSLGRRLVDDMVDEGVIDRMVNKTLADTWERMAGEDEYAHISHILLGMAQRARAGDYQSDDKRHA